MRFLIVAERELRAAARRKGTYILRWATGLGFFVLLIWLMWAIGALQSKNRVHELFNVFSVLVFFYCLLVGAVRTADCISSERREGTLGLLFLTNVNSLEIIAGKLCSNALPTVYGLLAIFPMLALPLLMGGVTSAEFGRMMLALLNAILFSLGCGFLASVWCKRQFPAVAVAMGLALVFGAGTFGAATLVDEFKGPAWLMDALSTTCPLYTVAVADGTKLFKANHYWLSLGNVAVVALGALVLATLGLARSRRDRPKSAPRRASGTAFGQFIAARQNAGRAALRQRLLNRNAFFWLTARKQISAPIFMLIVVALVLITLFGTTPLCIKLVGSQRYGVVLGSMLAWVWTALAIHVLALYYAAMISSQALAEDKQTGALELIFATPMKEDTIARGLWMAFRRRMLFPAIAAILAHGYFIWLVMTMTLLDPPGAKLPPGMMQWEVFWKILFNDPIGGRMFPWEFVLIIRVLAGILLVAPVLWFTLAWVGRWLGLRMKHPGFAPMVALALLVVPPTLVFSLACYLADEFGLFRTSDRIWAPWVAGGAFGTTLAHCGILSSWASRRLRDNFRSAVIGRFDVVRRTWAQRARSTLRFTVRATGFVAACALLAVGYYGCQSFRSRQAWSQFQAELKQKNVSLEVAELLPTPTPDEQNFARSREFQNLLSHRDKALSEMTDRLPDLDNWQRYHQQHEETHAWTRRRPAPLDRFARWMGVPDLPPESSKPVAYGAPAATPDLDGATNNPTIAPLILKALQPVDASLDALAVAARRPTFQTGTNRNALAVIQPSHTELKAVARLQFLFTLRALASLETGKPDRAAEDVSTSLRLTRLASQSPDAASVGRTHILLVRSLQPLWEGLHRHQWTEPQLARIESELAPFTLLANYTNTVRRVVRANIEIWRAIPEKNVRPIQLPDPSGGFRSSRDWTHMPQNTWFDLCIQLHLAGEIALNDVNAASERIDQTLDWGDLSDLPLDQESQELLQMTMPYWSGGDPKHLSFAQTSLNQARVAIALERERLANQRYPKSLSELVPAHFRRIPNDLAVGRPLLYEPNTNGTFLLRGLGQNHLNDGTNSYSDDWLWAPPTNALTTPILEP